MGLSTICTPVDGGGSVKEMTEELECHQTTISLCLRDGTERDIIEPGWEILNEECRSFIKDVTRVIDDNPLSPPATGASWSGVISYYACALGRSYLRTW